MGFNLKSQSTNFGESNNTAAPSASSLPSYTKNPISLVTGIPDINIPFFSLPTHSSQITINTGISYHPNNTFAGSKSSDVGLGWSMYGGGCLIFNEINSANGYPTQYFSFSLFGKTGRFKFYKDSNNNEVLQKVTVNNYEIIPTVINTGTNTGAYKFTIKDEMGFVYFFDILDTVYNAGGGLSYPFTSAYFLSKIQDPFGLEILSCEYQEDNYTIGIHAVKGLKIKKIKSLDFGTVQYNYTFDSLERKTFNDPFKLENVELKDNNGKIVQKYSFQSGSATFIYPYNFSPWAQNPCGNYMVSKRVLSQLFKHDSNNNLETTQFAYEQTFSNTWSTLPDPAFYCSDNEVENPYNLGNALLRSITFPTGAKVKYEFEPNQYFVDKNNADYLYFHAPPYEIKDREAQTYEDIATIPFDVPYGTSLGFITIPQNPDNVEGSSYLKAWLQVDEYYPNPFQTSPDDHFLNVVIIGGILDTDNHKKHMPGLNNYEIHGTGGKGNIIIKRFRYKSLPLQNYSTGKGVRIKKIEYYENNSLIESQTQRFDYQKFDNNNMTSGILSQSGEDMIVLYKNLKESTGNNKGHTEYYFKTLEDYPENLDSNGKLKYDLKYYNLLVNGLLAKSEIFDTNNNVVSQEINDFEFYEIPGQYQVNENSNILRNNAIISKLTNTSTLYSPSGSIIQISETTRDTNDFNVKYRKSIGADGIISEQFLTYPWNYKNIDPRLWNAGIKNIPLISESIVNGKTVSKIETKYEDVNNFYPTSQYSYLPDNLNQGIKDVSYDIYDDKGNLVQFTTYPDVGGVGKSTTVIWGYHKTMPIAKIEGVKLSNIPAGLITSIVNASNEDADATTATENAKEKLLIDALNTFRNDPAMKNFMVSSFTYNPLIGVTNTISANGMMESYVYDSYNRLHSVKDVDGNTVKSYQYNYKH